MTEAQPAASTQPEATLVAVRSASSMRSVNSKMRQLETFPLSDPIYLFCECQNPTCYAVIPLSVAAFDATVAEQAGWLLAKGHEPSEPWQPSEPVPARETAAPDSSRATWVRKRRAGLSRTVPTGLRHRS